MKSNHVILSFIRLSAYHNDKKVACFLSMVDLLLIVVMNLSYRDKTAVSFCCLEPRIARETLERLIKIDQSQFI